jgi:hypothetical protein
MFFIADHHIKQVRALIVDNLNLTLKDKAIDNE